MYQLGFLNGKLLFLELMQGEVAGGVGDISLLSGETSTLSAYRTKAGV